MSEPAKQHVAKGAAKAPRTYNFEDVEYELDCILRDTLMHGYVIGEWRDRRIDIVRRLKTMTEQLFRSNNPEIRKELLRIMREFGGKAR